MKSSDVTIQIKPLQQYFHMILFIQFVHVVLTFESVDKTLCCNFKPFKENLFGRTFAQHYFFSVIKI